MPPARLATFGKPRLLEKLRDTLAAPARFALHDNLAVAIDLRKPLRNLILRNELTADIRDLIFERLANIENEQVLTSVHAPLQFPHAELGNSILHCLFLFGFGPNAAELLVVDEFRYRRMRAADWAIGILA